MRTIPKAALAVGVGGLLSSCRLFGDEVAKLYRYRTTLRIDGQVHVFENSGRYVFRQAKIGGTEWLDYPMQSAAKLPSGEVVLVRPPNLKWAIEAAFGGPGNWIARKIDALRAAPYLKSQRPRVYIFDSATAPARVEAYLMPVGLDGRSRVEFVDQSNEFVDDEDWTSQEPVFPWYATCEPYYRYRGGYSTATDSDRSHHSTEPQPELRTWIVQLVPQIGSTPLTLDSLSLPAEFGGIVEALNRGERVDLPLQLSTADGCKLSLAPNLSAAIGYRLGQADLDRLGAAGCPVSATAERNADRKFFRKMLSYLSAPLAGNLQFGNVPGSLDLPDGNRISIEGRYFPLQLSEPTRDSDSGVLPFRPDAVALAHLFQHL